MCRIAWLFQAPGQCEPSKKWAGDKSRPLLFSPRVRPPFARLSLSSIAPTDREPGTSYICRGENERDETKDLKDDIREIQTPFLLRRSGSNFHKVTCWKFPKVRLRFVALAWQNARYICSSESVEIQFLRYNWLIITS